MAVDKEKVIEAIRQLPDESTYEDILKLFMCSKKSQKDFNKHTMVKEYPIRNFRNTLKNYVIDVGRIKKYDWYSMVSEAIEDFDEIYVYLARESLIYAENLYDKIEEIIKNIQKFPKMGELSQNIRIH